MEGNRMIINYINNKKYFINNLNNEEKLCKCEYDCFICKCKTKENDYVLILN